MSMNVVHHLVQNSKNIKAVFKNRQAGTSQSPRIKNNTINEPPALLAVMAIEKERKGG